METATSSSHAQQETNQLLPSLVASVKTLAADLEEAKRESKESKRRMTHFEQRVGGSEPGMNLPAMYNRDEMETEEPVLIASELNLRAARALDCMEALVTMQRPVLHEIACGPDPVITEKMRAVTG